MLKKILYGLTLMAAMASCTDDYTDWASPQVNPEEAAQNVSLTVANAPAVNYDGLTAETVQLFVPTLTTTEQIEGITTSYKAVLTGTEGDSAIELDTDENGYVAADELKSAVETLYGKRPVVRQVNLAVTAYTLIGTQSIANTGNAVLNVTLKAPFIDTAYYLTGDFAGWNQEGALAFTHLGDGDVYDAPEFQIVFQTTADNQYWKIISGTNYNGDFWSEGETGVVGTVVDGDTSMEGNLTTTGPQAGKIEEAGIYRMTINMMNYTYKLEKLNFARFVYFIGATDGWANAEQKLETANFDGIYTGYLYCADPNGWGNEFKFQQVPGDWGTEINTGHMTGGITGDFGIGGGGNFSATAGEGLYYVTLNLAAGTINAVRINNMNLVGDFNGWNAADDAQQMTWDADNYCYVITGAGVTANGWKFTTNNSWDINLGGALNALEANGDNITAVGNTIKLYPTRKGADNIYCTVE